MPGAIQPHGVLLALAEPTLQLVQCSSNASILGATPSTGWSLKQLWASSGKRIEEKLAQLPPEGTQATYLGNMELACPGGTRAADILAHRRDGMLILELEFSDAPAPVDPEESPSRLIEFLSKLEGIGNADAICALAAEEVRRLTGFDRVLIYKFDASWHGVVIAENRNERLPSYLGHWFPASDIPAQARELYRLNRSRLIPNSHYTPVPLQPHENPLTGRPLDLTFSVLRSVSPVHVEYMRNMGTAASMSFSIVRGGQLWGLISCHHATPRHVPFFIRRSCELVAQVLSLELGAAERQATVEQRISLRKYGSQLLAAMTLANDFTDGLMQQSEALLMLTDAQGAALVSGGKCVLIGRTPTEDQVQSIVRWLRANASSEQVFRCNDLPARLPGAERFAAVASGLLSIQVSSTTNSYVIWFRPEVIQTVVWAGDPNKVPLPQFGEERPNRLNPRKSFEAWTQIVRGTSAPWSEAQVAAASDLHADVVGIVLRKAEALAALSAELQRSNRELESFSYSVSHDLRAPFRHIVGYAELLRDFEGPRLSERSRRYAQIVIDAARDAGRLIDNLLAFSQMARTGLNPIPLDLNILITECRDEVMSVEGSGRKIVWNIGSLPTVVADPAMLRQAVRNLLSNAVKYTRPKGDATRIEVQASEDERETIIAVRDNGVGFDMQYADKLFGVFQRLHRMEEFEGTGIGLANVRRIIERHGGRVWAEGRVDEGAAFFFSLPKREPAH